MGGTILESIPPVIPEDHGFSFEVELTRDNREGFLLEVLAPLCEVFRADPSFVRTYFTYTDRSFSTLKVRILARSRTWAEGEGRERVRDRIPESTFLPYQRETSRYFGEPYVSLAEEVFFRDSELCLKLMASNKAASEGYPLWFVDLLLADQLYRNAGFSLERRQARIPRLTGHMNQLESREVQTALERDAAVLREFAGPYLAGGASPEEIWGSNEVADAVSEYFDRVTPVVNTILALHRREPSADPELGDALMEKFAHARSIRLAFPFFEEVLVFLAWMRVLESYSRG